MVTQSERPTVKLIISDERIRSTIESMTSRLGYAVTSFNSAIEFRSNYDRHKNSCLIVDNKFISSMQSQIAAPFIFISEGVDVKTISKAFKMGALDTIEYSDAETILPMTLLEGMQQDISKKKLILEVSNAQELLGMLTSKEQEVLALLARGFCHKKIAKIMNISFRTVEAHSSHIKLKTKIATSELIYITSPLLPR
jgi:two-component system response regulator FixJ